MSSTKFLENVKDLETTDAFFSNMLMLKPVKYQKISTANGEKRSHLTVSRKCPILKEKYDKKLKDIQSQRVGSKERPRGSKKKSFITSLSGDQKKSPISTASVGVTSDGSDRNDETPELSHSYGKKIHLKKQLRILQKHDKNIQQMKKTEGVQPAVQAHSQKQMEIALAKCEGYRPKDDPTRISKTLKRHESRKKKSQSEWSKRAAFVTERREQAQQKRKENLKNRIKDRKAKKLKTLQKKGRLIDFGS